MVINVYERYFGADAVFSGIKRNGALVMLISDSEAGQITYRAAVTFFPHTDEEDFASLDDKTAEKYRKRFLLPEEVMRFGKQYVIHRYDPEEVRV